MKYNCNKMREFASAIMQKNGLSKQKSDLFAESLIAADMRGISSHGVTRLKTYAYRLETGLVDAHAETTIIKETPLCLSAFSEYCLYFCILINIFCQPALVFLLAL